MRCGQPHSTFTTASSRKASRHGMHVRMIFRCHTSPHTLRTRGARARKSNRARFSSRAGRAGCSSPADQSSYKLATGPLDTSGGQRLADGCRSSTYTLAENVKARLPWRVALVQACDPYAMLPLQHELDVARMCPRRARSDVYTGNRGQSVSSSRAPVAKECAQKVASTAALPPF